MNTQKSVFKKIAQIKEQSIELSEEQRVEFGLQDYDLVLDLIADESTKIKKQIGKLGTIKKELQQLAKIAGQASVDVANAFKKAESQLKQDLKAAKDLGVDDSPIKEKFRFLKQSEAQLQNLAERMVQDATASLKALG